MKIYMACPITQGGHKKAASPPHMDGSVVFARWRQCAPHIYKAKKMVVVAISLKTLKSAMSSSNSLTQKIHHRIKQRAASYHSTEVIAHQKPKSGCHINVLYVQGIGNICILLADHSNLLHNQLPSSYRCHKASYSKLRPKIGCHGNVPQHRWTPSKT